VTEGRSCRDELGVAGGVSNGSGSHGAPMVQPQVGDRLLTPRFLVLGVFACWLSGRPGLLHTSLHRMHSTTRTQTHPSDTHR